MSNCPHCDKELVKDFSSIVELSCWECQYVTYTSLNFNATTIEGLENFISYLNKELTKMKEMSNE